MAKFANSVAAFVVALLLVGSLGLGVYALIHSGVVACHDTTALRDSLITILHSGQKGLPENPYYKLHPDQLAQAQAGYAQALATLHSVVCA